MHYTLYNIVIGGTLKRAFFVNLTIKSAAKKMNIVSVAIISQSYMELSIAHNGILINIESQIRFVFVII